jgi:hypothetical protein
MLAEAGLGLVALAYALASAAGVLRRGRCSHHHHPCGPKTGGGSPDPDSAHSRR